MVIGAVRGGRLGWRHGVGLLSAWYAPWPLEIKQEPLVSDFVQ
jgi:hypothetical protein